MIFSIICNLHGFIFFFRRIKCGWWHDWKNTFRRFDQRGYNATKHNFEFATDLNEDENTNVEEATNVPRKECPLNGALLAENTIFETHRKIQTFGVFQTSPGLTTEKWNALVTSLIQTTKKDEMSALVTILTQMMNLTWTKNEEI